jgi:hypothetical protein
MRRFAVLVPLTFVACYAYQPGAISGQTVGCLDIRVDLETDPQAQGPVAAYTIGNRCDAAVVVDLAAVRATAGGRVVRHRDPRGEIGPKVLEARSVAQENIEYTAHAGDRLCLDLSRVDRASRGPAQQVCL